MFDYTKNYNRDLLKFMDLKVQLKIIYWASNFSNVNIQKYIVKEKCSLQIEIIISE